MASSDLRRRMRFELNVSLFQSMESGCWEWTAHKYPSGYGQFWWGERKKGAPTMKAHRAAWMIYRGEIPEGKMVLHKCNNTGCVNPSHLYIGDHIQNMRDRDDAGRTSRWSHRYNFKRSAQLVADAKECFRTGLNVAETCDKLKIGWQTLYRMRKQDEELKKIMVETKSARYRRSAEKR